MGGAERKFQFNIIINDIEVNIIIVTRGNW